jgi:hypothetical protein
MLVAALARKLLSASSLQNPDVERYDKSGLRSAMTATHAALQKELAKCRPAAHVPTPVWVGLVFCCHQHVCAGWYLRPMVCRRRRRPLSIGSRHTRGQKQCQVGPQSNVTPRGNILSLTNGRTAALVVR